MKSRIGIVVLVIVSVALGISLFMVKNKAGEEKKADTERILTLSNKWVDVSGKLDEQKQVAAMLEKDMDTQKKNLSEVSNQLTQVSLTLGQTESTLKETQAEVTRRDARITELEAQNQALDKKSADLTAEIASLNGKIDDTQKKLLASEGDRAFLEKELKQMIAQKADLERQFNDLAVVRAQLAHLREEMAIAKRLEWTRQGLYASAEQKGAQKLLQGASAPSTQAKAPRANYDLNVEVTSDGSVKVVPPATNAPAAR